MQDSRVRLGRGEGVRRIAAANANANNFKMKAMVSESRELRGSSGSEHTKEVNAIWNRPIVEPHDA